MDIENSSDTLMLTATGPVEKTLTYEEESVDHPDVDATKFTAETDIQGNQSVTVELEPTPDLENHVVSGFEDDHSGFVTWIFASYLENSDEGWYPIRYNEWGVEVTTTKPGEHPDNLFLLCAEERADRDGTTAADVLQEWAKEDYFDTEKINAALRVARNS